jgi:hypothetical protein
LRPDFASCSIQRKYCPVVGHEINNLTVRHRGGPNFTLRIEPTLAESPVDLAGIDSNRNPFVFARAKYDTTVHLCETGRGPLAFNFQRTLPVFGSKAYT